MAAYKNKKTTIGPGCRWGHHPVSCLFRKICIRLEEKVRVATGSDTGELKNSRFLLKEKLFFIIVFIGKFADIKGCYTPSFTEFEIHLNFQSITT